MKVEIKNSSEVLAALRTSVHSMNIDMYNNTKDEELVLSAFVVELEAAIEREALYDDSRSHTRIDGMVRSEHYCEYHDQYEESDA